MNDYKRSRELCKKALNSEIPNEEALIRIDEITQSHEQD